jgi:hypothetical protein
VVGTCTSTICSPAIFSSTARGVSPGGERAQALLEGDLPTVGEEGDEDVGLDALVGLVIDRPHREVVLELLGSVFTLHLRLWSGG